MCSSDLFPSHDMDDDTLLSTLKSRHIQSLSEIKSWTEYCIENFDDLLKAQLTKENESEELQKTSGEASAGAASGTGGSSE